MSTEEREPIAYTYRGKGVRYMGVPARSLTQAEYEDLTPQAKRELHASGAYAHVEPEKATKTSVPSGGKAEKS
ncbi:MAG: hypothetical protein M3440_14105 [Chloroflexota bacterium]|nr:hypothetical protein [Chloroflexota bacterium]